MARVVSPKDIFALPGMSPGVVAGGPFLFVSGQVALDENGAVVGEDDFPRQVAQVMSNLKSVLNEGGSGLKDVLKMSVFLSDRKHLAEWRRARGEYFSDPFPASTLVMTGLILPELMIEIEAIAVVSRSGLGSVSSGAG